MVEERRRARAACDLEGNRAGLGYALMPRSFQRQAEANTTPKGALALHLLAPWGKGGATWWFETDAGVLLEAKPVAPVETTRTPRVRVVATSGGGGFGKQRLLFAKLRIVRCFSSLGHLNDCECTVLTPSVYAVYAISSLDTGSPLRHRTQHATPSGHPGSLCCLCN